MCELEPIPKCEVNSTGIKQEENSTNIDETTTTEKSISDKINFSYLASMLAIFFWVSLLNRPA